MHSKRRKKILCDCRHHYIAHYKPIQSSSSMTVYFSRHLFCAGGLCDYAYIPNIFNFGNALRSTLLVYLQWNHLVAAQIKPFSLAFSSNDHSSKKKRKREYINQTVKLKFKLTKRQKRNKTNHSTQIEAIEQRRNKTQKKQKNNTITSQCPFTWRMMVSEVQSHFAHIFFQQSRMLNMLHIFKKVLFFLSLQFTLMHWKKHAKCNCTQCCKVRMRNA